MKKTVMTLGVLTALFTSAHAGEVYATFDVEATRHAELSLSAGGIISQIDVDVGSEVKKGDLLLSLDNADQKSALDVAKANLQSAQTRLTFASRAYDRQAKVKDIIDQAAFDKYALELQSAKSAHKQAEANLALQQTLLDKTMLKAPFDGVISEKLTEVGNAISGGNPKTLLKLQSKNEVKLMLSFDQKYWKEVAVGSKFSYKLDGDSALHEGTIAKIYPYADEKTRKIKAEVITKDILPGLFGDGSILTQGK